MKTLWLFLVSVLLSACMSDTIPGDETLDDVPSSDDLIPLNLAVSATLDHGDGDILITWDTVDGALYYVLSICISEFVVTANHHVLATKPDHIYALRVKAVFEDGESKYSAVVSHHTFDVMDVVHGTFTRFSQESVTLTIPVDAIIIDVHTTHVILSVQAYTVHGNTITLNKPFLDQLATGIHYVIASTCCGHFLIEIEILPPVVPHVHGNTVMHYQPGKDVPFVFNLMGGAITYVSANDLTVDDYRIDNETLFIRFSYIDARMDQDPGLTLILITYQITYPEGVIVGMVFINLPS